MRMKVLTTLGVCCCCFVWGCGSSEAKRDAVLDDCEDGDERTSSGGYWASYDDNVDQGESIVAPPPFHSQIPFLMSEPGANGSERAVRVAGTTGDLLGFDYFGAIASLGPNSYCPDPEPPAIALSEYRAVSFMAKARMSGGTLSLVLAHRKNGATDNCKHNGFVGDTLTNWQDYTVNLTPKVSESWGHIVVDFRKDLTSSSGVDIESVLANAKDLVWQYMNGLGGEAEFWLDDVTLLR